jgi:nitrile hydratase accessory protein
LNAPDTLLDTWPDPDATFAEPWHAQIFALTHKLAQAGHYSWLEWAERFSLARAQSASSHAPDLDATYYDDWLKTFEQLLLDKGLADQASIEILKEAWTEAYLDTPHGEPVLLKNT